MDTISIGPVPANEECTPVRTGKDYLPAMCQECRAFAHQLRRKFGDPPADAAFFIKSNPHEFGEYLEVAVRYDPSSREAVEFAFRVDDEAPTEWDDEAQKELNGGHRPETCPEKGDGREVGGTFCGL